jgi:hypothetical protein
MRQPLQYRIRRRRHRYLPRAILPGHLFPTARDWRIFDH